MSAVRRFLGAVRSLPPEAWVPCLGVVDLGQNPWLSENHEVREVAAEACDGCPVAVECLTLAVEGRETFGVWGGIDVGARGGRASAVERVRSAA